MIADHDLCRSVTAAGLAATTTPIERFVGVKLVMYRDGEAVDRFEMAMPQPQIRSILVVKIE
jgi:hypothetical protein